jgi:hypothetical protein
MNPYHGIRVTKWNKRRVTFATRLVSSDRFSLVNIIVLLLINYAKIDTSKPAIKRV